MELTKVQKKQEEFSNEMNVWFDALIASIKADKLLLETDTAGKDKKELYTHLIKGDTDPAVRKINQTITQTYVSRMATNFLNEISKRQTKPVSLSIALSGTVLHIWAVINDDDEKAESDIYLAEAKVNAEYNSYGYGIDTVILEASDNYPIPPHYQKIF